jgi:hypothetical protein
MTAAQALEDARGMTFEQFWASLVKLRERQEETAEIVRQLSIDVDKVTKNVGGLNRSIGELIETLIAARLWEKFPPEYGLARAYQRVRIYDEKNRDVTDVDVLLSNGEWAVAVEVKREPDLDDLKHHLKRMELVRKYPPAEVVGKKLLGAISGGVVPPDVRNAAFDAGLFVLELNGDNVSFVAPPKEFKAHKW